MKASCLAPASVKRPQSGVHSAKSVLQTKLAGLLFVRHREFFERFPVLLTVLNHREYRTPYNPYEELRV